MQKCAPDLMNGSESSAVRARLAYARSMTRALAIVTAFCTSGLVIAAQPTSSSARLSQVIDTLVAGQGRGAPRADTAALLATDIDRRFAETILVGRQISAEHRSGPMGKEAYTRMLREQYLLPYAAETLW